MTEKKRHTVFRCVPCGAEEKLAPMACAPGSFAFWREYVGLCAELGGLGWEVMIQVRNNVNQGYGLHCPKCVASATIVGAAP